MLVPGVGETGGVGASTVTEELPAMERLATRALVSVLRRAANGNNAGVAGATGFCGNDGV
ncbi:hypothetical protein JG687_00012741 [Phytophthora cactorum]|uniref:Uncharacterized protein n=1 Tax=Phytophthora cactorum TaxID=29920 RepID=A0A8T1U3L0_9STRA|nr:hypothetical protein PC120_g5234 [Phytophthora cactorum]KAG3179619.1 hypothetical protein PC128_g15855 [Phytophthora cactorum]KAG4053436.1 hypothetical protein PC123_g11416 [Phytophthora cactorum]KAG6952857.1 hypothetical protein JG687_00012741 [Phytophthora cactorum]